MKNLKQIFALAAIFCFLATPAALKAQEDVSVRIDTSYFIGGNDNSNLIEAVIKNDSIATALVLKRGADPDALSTTGNSALMYATEKGNIQIMSMLVEYGATVNFFGFDNETPLLIAVLNNDFQATKFLLEHGAEPNVKDNYGVTPLIYAAATNQYQSADLLLFYDADPEVTDDEGNDPLLTAVTFENLETSDVLLQNGLNPNASDNHGNTPVIVAIQHGSYPLLDLLLDYEADINLANNKNYTPLAYAVTYKDVKATQILLDKGADVNHKVDKGRNIAELARVSENDSVIDIIKQSGGKLTPGVDFSEFNMTFGNSFNSTDYMLQFRGGLTDSKRGFYFETGIDYRPYLLKIQTTIDDTTYLFRERLIGWSHSIGKYQKLFDINKNLHVSAYAALNGLLYFPRYMGSSAASGADYKIIPSAGLALSGNYIGFKAGIDWYDFNNEIDKGLKYNLSIFIRMSHPEVNYDRKEIYWE